jgi:hypothetical protein
MFRPSVGGPFLFLYFPNGRSLADGRQWAKAVYQVDASPPKAMPTPSRSSSTLGSSPGIGAW